MKTPKLTYRHKAEVLGEVAKFITGDDIVMQVWGTFPPGTKASRWSGWSVDRASKGRLRLHFQNYVTSRVKDPPCKIIISHFPKPGFVV